MITLNVPGMHCMNCVKRIQNAFDAEGIACTISLEAKTVAVDDAAEAAAVQALDDLGFDAAKA